MAITKKRAPHSPTKELNRIVQTIYDDLNEIINAVNQSTGEARSTASGSKGDLRVIKDRTTSTYKLEAYTEDGWAETELTISTKE